jgi:hypothetical protein
LLSLIDRYSRNINPGRSKRTPFLAFESNGSGQRRNAGHSPGWLTETVGLLRACSPSIWHRFLADFADAAEAGCDPASLALLTLGGLFLRVFSLAALPLLLES